MFTYCASLKWWSVNWCALEKGRKSYAQTACKYLGEQTIRGSSRRTQINLIAKHHEKVADQTCARGVKDKKICHEKNSNKMSKILEFFSKILGVFFCLSLTSSPLHPPLNPSNPMTWWNLKNKINPIFLFFFSQQSQSSQNYL